MSEVWHPHLHVHAASVEFLTYLGIARAAHRRAMEAVAQLTAALEEAETARALLDAACDAVEAAAVRLERERFAAQEAVRSVSGVHHVEYV